MEKERKKERTNIFFSILWKAFFHIWYVFENTVSWNCMVQDPLKNVFVVSLYQYLFCCGLLLLLIFSPPFSDLTSYHILKGTNIKTFSPVRTFQLDLSHSYHSFFQKYSTFSGNFSPFKLTVRMFEKIHIYKHFHVGFQLETKTKTWNDPHLVYISGMTQFSNPIQTSQKITPFFFF